MIIIDISEKLRNIRSSHLGKLHWFEGAVRQKSDVRPQVTSARFECPSCGNIIPVLQLDKQFKDVGVKIIYFPYTEGTSSTLINQTLLNLRKDK